MQNRQSGRRRRGGGGNNPRPMGMAQGGQNANRLEVRVRGNAHQLLEKYKVLARDAHQAGDRVATEYYLQHADHYFRVLNDSRIRQEEMRGRRGMFDQMEDDADDDGNEADGDSENDADEQPRDSRERRPEQGRRPREGTRDGARESGRDSGGRDNRRDAGRQDPGEARDDMREDGGERGDDRRRAERIRPDNRTAESRLSDGEAALVAFGGPPAREPLVADGGTAGPEVADAPPPKRRGRPRKTEVPAES